MARRTSVIWHKLFPFIFWTKPQVDRKVLYLTFDDGPTREISDFVLRELSFRKILASFFLMGNKASADQTTLDRLLDEGHSIANHTYDHECGWWTSYDNYVKSVRYTDLLLQPYPNYNKKFRPPYGKVTLRQLFKLRNSYGIVMWSLMSEDYNTKLSPEECLKSLIDKTRSGDVVVFHDNKKSFPNLKYVLPRYLDDCLAKGYHFDLI